MNQPQLYSKYNGLQRNDAVFVIENYLRLVKWQKEKKESILDIGCGEGNVTLELLVPKLPKHFGKFIGMDISEDMINAARKECKNSRIKFIRFDIATENVPVEYENQFDHIFSFYCLHWVQDQKKAFENMYTMLKPGGDMLIAFLASNPVYEIYQNMGKKSKWHPYMKDFEAFISPYHNEEEPEKKLDVLLNEVGFITHVCRAEKRSYVFPSFPVLQKSVMAVCPFISRIPEHKVINYIEDSAEEIRKLEMIKIENYNNNNEEQIEVPYKLFVVFASKRKDAT